MGTGSDPCQDEMEKKKQSPRLILALCLAVCMGFAASEILKSDPLVRLIPADVLRDFPGKCYSWVNQKWYQPKNLVFEAVLWKLTLYRTSQHQNQQNLFR